MQSLPKYLICRLVFYFSEQYLLRAIKKTKRNALTTLYYIGILQKDQFLDYLFKINYSDFQYS